MRRASRPSSAAVKLRIAAGGGGVGFCCGCLSWGARQDWRRWLPLAHCARHPHVHVWGGKREKWSRGGALPSHWRPRGGSGPHMVAVQLRWAVGCRPARLATRGGLPHWGAASCAQPRQRGSERWTPALGAIAARHVRHTVPAVRRSVSAAARVGAYAFLRAVPPVAAGCVPPVCRIPPRREWRRCEGLVRPSSFFWGDSAQMRTRVCLERGVGPPETKGKVRHDGSLGLIEQIHTKAVCDRVRAVAFAVQPLPLPHSSGSPPARTGLYTPVHPRAATSKQRERTNRDAAAAHTGASRPVAESLHIILRPAHYPPPHCAPQPPVPTHTPTPTAERRMGRRS